MTHTLHRTGDLESIREDFPMLTHVARGFNDKDAGPRLKQIAQTMTKYTDLHFGDCKVGNKYTMDSGEIMEKLTVGCQVVFKDKESLIACMKELKKKDQGISIVVSGLFDEVFDCCHQAGLKPPLIEFALGVHGNTKKLWPPEILDFVTMCGHGLVSGRLVKKMVQDIKKKKITVEKAAIELAKPCLCGIFNPYRAAKLLRKMVEK
ncbi:MAG: hypothetical protein OEW45_08815 [Deltaproteobacteria bacterium]|jgi:hypothetical protein|nr:hypothetical protein [Deltaproteobacteria bacterium]